MGNPYRLLETFKKELEEEMKNKKSKSGNKKPSAKINREVEKRKTKPLMIPQHK